MPASIHTSFQGTAAAFRNSLSSEPLLILAAIITVYIVLGVLYESYIHPITILSTLPSAGVGALLALLITGNDLGVVSLIGIILLIGIVKKNALMMIAFALAAEGGGVEFLHTFYQAASGLFVVDDRCAACRHSGVPVPAGGSFTPGGISGDSGTGVAPRSKSGDHGFSSGDSAGAPVRAHCGRE